MSAQSEANQTTITWDEFLNRVATNPKARRINVRVGGSNPGGPPNLPIPGQRRAR